MTTIFQTPPQTAYQPPVAPHHGIVALGAVPGALASVVTHDSLACVATDIGRRVDFSGIGTAWLSGAPSIAPSAGSLGAITVDSGTTCHATYTPPATAQTVTFTDTTDNGSTATLVVVSRATGYAFVSPPSSGAVGVASTGFVVRVTPSGSALSGVDGGVLVFPAISPDGSVDGVVALNGRIVDAQSDPFHVTPAAAGVHTVSVSSGGELIDPAPVSYTAVVIALISAATHDGLVLVMGGAARRVDFAGQETTWFSGTPTILPGSGSMGAITVDDDTHCHATYTPPAPPTPPATLTAETFVDTTDGSSIAYAPLAPPATGYTLNGPPKGRTGRNSAPFTVALLPAGSAIDVADIVTPTIASEGTVSGTVVLLARTVDASGTFRVTANVGGAHTVSVTDSGGLSDPSSKTYTAATVTGKGEALPFVIDGQGAQGVMVDGVGVV